LTGTCTATKRDGSPCTLPPHGSGALCWAHDPKNAERRRRGQSRGGKSKPSRELTNIKALLSDLTDRVLGKEGTQGLTTGAAAVANQLINTRLRAAEIERKLREEDELLERIEALERAAQNKKGGGGWRAPNGV
jgi:hypothetical protein